MRMTQCEVYDSVWVMFILCDLEDTTGHNGFVSFWPVQEIFEEKKSHLVSEPTVGFHWVTYQEFRFFIMCHLFLISRGLSGSFLLTRFLKLKNWLSYERGFQTTLVNILLTLA